VFIAFSPERVDPGNQVYKTKNTPEGILGAAASPECLQGSEQACTRTYPGQDCAGFPPREAAEMVKLLGDTPFAPSISGSSHEIAMMSRKLGIDPFEGDSSRRHEASLASCRSTRGPGLGGHCIPNRPAVLVLEAAIIAVPSAVHRACGFESTAACPNVMSSSERSEALNDHRKPVRGSRILIYGVAYKRDVGDFREVPGVRDHRRARQARGGGGVSGSVHPRFGRRRRASEKHRSSHGLRTIRRSG